MACRPAIRACLAVAALVPMLAHGSFNGTPCRADFGCHFFAWGGLIGIVAVPISALIFGLLHLVLCHPARSKVRQLFLGAFIGMVAYEVTAACVALVQTWTWGKTAPGQYVNFTFVSAT